MISKEKTKSTYSRVSRACINCSRAHACCDRGRPCTRCKTLGLENSCFDVKHQKRGRKKNTQKNNKKIKKTIKLHPKNMIFHTTTFNGPNSKNYIQHTSSQLSPSKQVKSEEYSDSFQNDTDNDIQPIQQEEEQNILYTEEEPLSSLVSRTVSNICLSRVNNRGDLNRGVLVSNRIPFLSMLSESARRRWEFEEKQVTTWFELLHPSVHVGHYADLLCMSSKQLQKLVGNSIESNEDPISIDNTLGDMYPGSSLERTIFGNVLSIKARTLGRTQSGEVFEFYRACHVIFDRSPPHKLQYVVSYLQW